MTTKEIENKLENVITKITPNGIDDILSDCNQQERKVIVLKKVNRKNHWISFAAGAVAAIVLFAGGIFGLNTYKANTNVDSTILLDVNPSVEILTNKNEKVISVSANNEDGKKIIGNMDFNGSKLDVAVNALIGSMVRNGYISELANSILVSVENNDQAKAARLQKQLSDEIALLLKSNAFEGSVISQTVTKQDDAKKLSEAYNISEGKAKLIKQLIALNPVYTFEDLSQFSINELNLLKERYDKKDKPTISATGSASSKAYIGVEKAKKAALSHAKVSESKVKNIYVEFDADDGIIVYDVEFYHAGYEYDYEIDAIKGTVFKFDKERDDDYFELPDKDDDDDIRVNVSSKKPVSSKSESVSSSKISKSKAKSIALAHAKLKAADIIDYEIEYDIENGIAVYEIAFDANGYEYEYEIKADNGKVLKSQKERDD